MNQTPITYAPVLSTKLLVTQRPIPEFPVVDYDGYSLAVLDAPSRTIVKIMRARFIRGRGFAKLKIGHNGNYSYRNITVYINENMFKSLSYEDYVSVDMTDMALELKDEINTIDVVVTVFPTGDASEEFLSNKKMYVRCSNLLPISFFEESSDTPPGIEQSYMCPLGTNRSYLLRMPIEKGYYAVRLWIKRIGGSETPFALYENLDNAVIGSYNPTRIHSYSYWWINTDKYPENEWVSQIIYFKYTEEHDLTIKTYPNTVAGTLYVAYEKLSDFVWLPIRSFKDDFDGHKAVTTPPNIYMSDYMQNYTNTNRFYWDMENIPSTATMMSFYAKVVKHPWTTIGNYESIALEFYTSNWDYLSRVTLLDVNNTGLCTFDTTEWVRIDLPLPEGTQIVELYQNSYQSADWQFLMTEPEFIDPYAVLTKRVGLPQGTVIDYGSWALDPTHQYNGFPTYKSNTITDNQSTSFSFDVTVSEFCVFACYNAVSSESGYDFLKIYVDNVVKTVRSGDYADDWKKLTVPLDVGTHTIKIEYAKDYSVSAGLDCAWVSDFHLLVKEN